MLFAKGKKCQVIFALFVTIIVVESSNHFPSDHQVKSGITKNGLEYSSHKLRLPKLKHHDQENFSIQGNGAHLNVSKLTRRTKYGVCRALKGRKKRTCLRHHKPIHHLHRHHHSLKCGLCSPGQFAQSRCNKTRSTVCASCPVNTFSPHHSTRRTCTPCSQCGFTLYILHQCTPTTDTVCDSCITQAQRGPPFSADYHVKCQTSKVTAH